MILRNLRLVGEDERTRSLILDGALITAVDEGTDLPANSPRVLELGGALAFPGLVNSHDHLEFNLFRPTGHGPYVDYLAWAADVQQRHRREFERVLQVPPALRRRWGVLKNLLAGVTTVVHHGDPVSEPHPLDVYGQCLCLHSVAFEKRWRFQLNFVRHPHRVAIHAGEGIGAACHREIDRLLRWNLTRRPLIAIHGVAMSPSQAARFKALVWCPDSNRFLLGRSADVGELKRQTAILFGTDATLSADWNLWNHLRLARELGGLEDGELFEALTVAAAGVWGLGSSGKLKAGATADLVVAKGKPELSGWDAFFALEPQDLLLVLKRGMPVLLDAALQPEFEKRVGRTPGLHPLVHGDRVKYVAEDLASLVAETKKFLPDFFPPYHVRTSS